MLKNLIVVAATSLLSLSAFAVDHTKVDKAFELKDGSTVYIFKDGKMGMEDKKGRPTHMKEGQVMETKDGQKIMMKGNEIFRVEELLNKPRG